MAKIILLFILVLFGSCSQRIRIYAEYSSEYDFDTNKQFSWHTDSIPIPGVSFFSNPTTDHKMQEIILGQMESRGYSHSNMPNSLIFHHNILISQPKPSYEEDILAESVNPSVARPAKTPATFILYLVDPSSGKVVWKACTMQELQNSTLLSEEETIAQINGLLEDLIPAIFRHYPIDPSE